IGIGGGAAFSNDIQLDGVSIQGSAWNETAVLPNMDSLQEVRTITNNYSAEYGRAQGVVVFTTKSGTNQFHGSAGYRLRNDALNANSFLNNFIGLKRPPFKSNASVARLAARSSRTRHSSSLAMRDSGSTRPSNTPVQCLHSMSGTEISVTQRLPRPP